MIQNANFKGFAVDRNGTWKVWLNKTDSELHGKEFIVRSTPENITLEHGMKVEFLLARFPNEGDSIKKAVIVSTLS